MHELLNDQRHFRGRFDGHSMLRVYFDLDRMEYVNMKLDWEKINPEIVDGLAVEYRSTISTQEKSFQDIEAKSKYWLSGLVPSMVAIISYASTREIDIPLICFLGFLSGVMAIMAYFLMEALKVTRFSGGHSLPTNHDISEIHSMITGKEQEVLDSKYLLIRNRLRGIRINAISLTEKSKKLRQSYSLLPVALIGSFIAGICGAFIHNICPSVFPMAALIFNVTLGIVSGGMFVRFITQENSPQSISNQ